MAFKSFNPDEEFAPLFSRMQQYDVFDKMKTLIRDDEEYCDVGQVCWVIEGCIKSITRKVGTMGFSANSFAPQQQVVKQEQKQFLHGSDCKVAGKVAREVTLRVTSIRTAPPGFNAPLIMDFEPQFGKESLPLNKTNIRALGALVQEEWGDDDLERLIGHSVVFQIVNDKNPNTGEMVPTLRAASGGLIKSAKKPTPKPPAKK